MKTYVYRILLIFGLLLTMSSLAHAGRVKLVNGTTSAISGYLEYKMAGQTKSSNFSLSGKKSKYFNGVDTGTVATVHYNNKTKAINVGSGLSVLAMTN